MARKPNPWIEPHARREFKIAYGELEKLREEHKKILEALGVIDTDELAKVAHALRRKGE